MAAIDYGVMAFCNGEQIYSDDLYPVIEIESGGYSIECYKYICKIFKNADIFIEYYEAELADKYSFDGSKKKSAWFSDNEIVFHIKEVCDGVYRLTFGIDGKHYVILYGYGIDNNKAIWDLVKVRYLGKKRAKAVDREIWKATEYVRREE